MSAEPDDILRGQLCIYHDLHIHESRTTSTNIVRDIYMSHELHPQM